MIHFKKTLCRCPQPTPFYPLPNGHQLNNFCFIVTLFLSEDDIWLNDRGERYINTRSNSLIPVDIYTDEDNEGYVAYIDGWDLRRLYAYYFNGNYPSHIAQAEIIWLFLYNFLQYQRAITHRK